MSKFCNNCGAPLDEQSVFCANCGASTVSAPTATENNTAPAPQAEPAQPSKKLNKKLLTIGGAALAAVIILVVIIVSIVGNSNYTKPIDNYIDAMFYGKVSKLEGLAPAEFWDYYEEEYDENLDDLKDEYEEEWEDRLEELEDEYGSDYRVTYEIEKEKELSEKKVEKIAEALEDRYDIDADDVTAAYKLTGEISIEGDDGDDTQEFEWHVIKISGKWYLAYVSEYSDSYSVRFVLG